MTADDRPPVRCIVLGHDWRLTGTQADNGLHWFMYLCRHCPATIELEASMGRPDPAGIFTRGDIGLIAVLSIIAAAVVILGRVL